jgi:hypothetical protein
MNFDLDELHSLQIHLRAIYHNDVSMFLRVCNEQRRIFLE